MWECANVFLCFWLGFPTLSLPLSLSPCSPSPSPSLSSPSSQITHTQSYQYVTLTDAVCNENRWICVYVLVKFCLPASLAAVPRWPQCTVRVCVWRVCLCWCAGLSWIFLLTWLISGVWRVYETVIASLMDTAGSWSMPLRVWGLYSTCPALPQFIVLHITAALHTHTETHTCYFISFFSLLVLHLISFKEGFAWCHN